jgi:peptidoglycan L-alanyl-D-glutamate endopeptidase CwlK
MADSNLSDLHPELQPLCRKFIESYEATGRKVKITVTFRSKAEQDALYAQGRTAPGQIVTHSPGGHSQHEFTLPDGTPASKAFDFSLYDEDGNYIDDGTDDWYADAGAIGKNLGLEWGGDWPDSKKDWDHLELPV